VNPAPGDDAVDAPDVPDVGQGIGVEQDEVGGEAGGDRAELATAIEPRGRTAGRGQQRAHRREAGAHQQLELPVQ
jgi:hypothetical protein